MRTHLTQALDLDDTETLSVYADALEDRGDPLGPLIALGLAAAGNPALQLEVEQATAAYAEQQQLHGAQLTWRHGCIEQAIVVTEDVAQVQHLLQAPAMRCVQRLYFHPDADPFDPGRRLHHVSDFGLFAHLTQLRVLVATGARAVDLDPLRALSRLHTLALNETDVFDLAPLAGLALEYLGLRVARRVTELGPLAAMRSLRGLTLNGLSGITSFEPLHALDRLRSLAVCETSFDERDLSRLSCLPSLEELSIIGSRISDLSPLSRCPALRKVYPNTVQGLEALTDLAHLEYMEVFGLDEEPIRDLIAARRARWGDADALIVIGAGFDEYMEAFSEYLKRSPGPARWD